MTNPPQWEVFVSKGVRRVQCWVGTKENLTFFTVRSSHHFSSSQRLKPLRSIFRFSPTGTRMVVLSPYNLRIDETCI
ncbi:hypothetical protein D3C72_660320 [compost metagenome]